MADMQQYKCPNCGGSMVFDISSQMIKCEFCDSEYEVEKLDAISKAMTGAKEEQEATWDEYDEKNLSGMKSYSCSSCGAKVTVSDNTIATECVYCGNKITIESTSNTVAPDCIIPFKLDKNYAIDAFKKFYHGKLLLPSSFKSEHRINKITGLYVPFWLYDCDVDAKVSFIAENKQSFTSGDSEYVKIKYYEVNREGTLSFSKIPVDASKNMDNRYMDALEPYNFNDLIDYNAGYMAGYQADSYDEDSKQCADRANAKIKESVISEFKASAGNYDTINVKTCDISSKNNEIRYAFMPIWILNTKYKDKIYTFAINAQTGKLVGELPTSIPKFIGFSLASSVIVYIIINIIMQFI